MTSKLHGRFLEYPIFRDISEFKTCANNVYHMRAFSLLLSLPNAMGEWLVFAVASNYCLHTRLSYTLFILKIISSYCVNMTI